jgi:hypothetical protein
VQVLFTLIRFTDCLLKDPSDTNNLHLLKDFDDARYAILLLYESTLCKFNSVQDLDSIKAS